ncbi:MAG: 7-cyano-7-deazaguanine synthase QueC [Pseudomonadota bacterium]
MFKAVCLISGGLDSAVSTSIAAKDHEIIGVHFNYGQKTEKKELKAFNDLADFYNIEIRHEIKIPVYGKLPGSSLTNHNLEISKQAPKDNEIPQTYVPFRNGMMLSVAASIAESYGANKIFIGAVWEDSSGYPDCRMDFLKSMEEAIDKGTRPETKIEICAPIIDMNKSEIIKKGYEIKTPFDLTWSCYCENHKACGKCESCYLRLKGFKAAGLKDPILYLKK